MIGGLYIRNWLKHAWRTGASLWFFVSAVVVRGHNHLMTRLPRSRRELKQRRKHAANALAMETFTASPVFVGIMSIGIIAMLPALGASMVIMLLLLLAIEFLGFVVYCKVARRIPVVIPDDRIFNSPIFADRIINRCYLESPPPRIFA